MLTRLVSFMVPALCSVSLGIGNAPSSSPASQDDIAAENRVPESGSSFTSTITINGAVTWSGSFYVAFREPGSSPPCGTFFDVFPGMICRTENIPCFPGDDGRSIAFRLAYRINNLCSDLGITAVWSGNRVTVISDFDVESSLVSNETYQCSPGHAGLPMDGCTINNVVNGVACDEAQAHGEGLSFTKERDPCTVTKYCTAKAGLLCGTPEMVWSGCPQAGASSAFEILAWTARGNRSGLVLYSCSGRAAIPFDGGLLCVAPSIRRTPPVISGGTEGVCDGVFRMDWNTFASGNGGGHPDPCIALPGQRVNAQWWGRDSVQTGSFLSDALEFDM